MILSLIINFVGIFTLVFCAVIALGLAYCWAIGLFDWH
jgi:NADH:ubiquinone oxidoreductase subunit 3 (subunit A)